MPVKASRIIRVIVIFIVSIAAATFLYLLIFNFQFTRGVEVRVHFSRVGDLNTGAWVRKAGIKVASVTKLEPTEDEKTVIVTLMFKPGKTVRAGDQFSLVAKGILGDMYIEQHPGPKESPLVESDHLFEGQPSFNISDLLGPDTMGLVTDLVGSIKGIVQVLQRNQDVLESSLKDISHSAHNVRIVTDRAVEFTNSVPQITGQITSSIDQLQATVTDVSVTTKRVLAKLEKNLDTSSDDLAVSMKSVRETTAEVQKAVDALTAQNSVISKLSSPDTAKSLEETVKNLQEISKGLLTVTKDTQKIVEGVSVIFQGK